jgi:hypothetical protein
MARADGDASGVARVVGLGGGLALDAAKLVAWRLGVPLVQVPSSASNNACFTRTSGCLERGRRAPMRDGPVPEAVVVDHELIARAPARLNRAGIGDLLSSHSALADWELAHRAGRAVDWTRRCATGRDRLDQLATGARRAGRLRPWSGSSPWASDSRRPFSDCRGPASRRRRASAGVVPRGRTGRRLLHGEIVASAWCSWRISRATRRRSRSDRAGRRGADPARRRRHQLGGDRAAVLALPSTRDVVPWYTVIDPLVDGDPARSGLRAAPRGARLRRGPGLEAAVRHVRGRDSALSDDLPRPSAERLQADIEALTRMTRAGRRTRRAFGRGSRRARWVAAEMRAAGSR